MPRRESKNAIFLFNLRNKCRKELLFEPLMRKSLKISVFIYSTPCCVSANPVRLIHPLESLIAFVKVYLQQMHQIDRRPVQWTDARRCQGQPAWAMQVRGRKEFIQLIKNCDFHRKIHQLSHENFPRIFSLYIFSYQ